MTTSMGRSSEMTSTETLSTHVVDPSIQDPASSLRAAALLTLKAKRRKPGGATEFPGPSPFRRPSVHENGVQLDYGGQDDATVPPQSPSMTPEVGPKEEGEIEEGEISESDVAQESQNTHIEKRLRSPSPHNPRKRINTAATTLAPIHIYPSSSKQPITPRTPKLESPVNPSPLFDRLAGSHQILHSTQRPPSNSLPQPPVSASLPQRPSHSSFSQRAHSSASQQTSVLPSKDVDQARPGLDLTTEQYDVAKDIVLDLLGWGVPPEYLVDCGLSREIIFYVFTELNLRLPHNLDSTGLTPYKYVTPTQNVLTQTQPSPTLSKSETVQSTSDQSVQPDLHDMERQRRMELMARKAAQASRKSKTQNDGSIASSTQLPDHLPTNIAPIDAVDDFLRTIEPEADAMVVDTANTVSAGLSRQPSMSLSDMEAVHIEQSLVSHSGSTTPAELSAPMPLALASSYDSYDAVTEEPAPPSATRRRGRPLAADFVDHPVRHNVNGTSSGFTMARRESGASFASISGLRRCVIDLSDSEDEEDVIMGDAPVVEPLQSSSSQAQDTGMPKAAVNGVKPTNGPSLVEKEEEIRRLRLWIAEKEELSRSKKLSKGNSGLPSSTPTPTPSTNVSSTPDSAPFIVGSNMSTTNTNESNPVLPFASNGPLPLPL